MKLVLDLWNINKPTYCCTAMDPSDRPSDRQFLITATFTAAVVIAGYIVFTERNKALAERELSVWIHDNKLDEVYEHFYMSDISSLDQLVHFDVSKSKQFAGVPQQKKMEIIRKITELRKYKALEVWLETQGLTDKYAKRLLQIGVRNLHQLQSLSDELVGPLTDWDLSLSDYQRLRSGISKLQQYDDSQDSIVLLEMEMLSHHKVGFAKNMYSVTGILRLVFMVVFVTGVTAVIMFVSRTHNWLQQSSTFCQTSKKSLLNLLSGHYDIPQNTKVIWDWEEPQTVGKTMSFRIKFYHKNGKPYPVSNKDDITVEITHNGSLVAKTMVLGSVDPNNANVATVSFTVHKSGDYLISIMFSARNIKGSPFTKKFEAGPIDASKTGFTNYTTTVVCTPDTSYPLTIEARDAFGNMALYRADQNNYFKIKVTEAGTNQKYVPGTQAGTNQKYIPGTQAGTNQKYVPGTQIFYNSIQKQLTMHIKMERVGCFQATVSYGDISLKNGDFNILVLSPEDLTCVDKNVKKSHNIWYEARLIHCNHEHLAKPKKVYIYITPKQLKLKEYFLKIIGKRLFTYRVCPSTKFTFSGFHNQTGSPLFTIDDGAQPPVILAAKDRSIIAATFTKFLLRNIGGSETFQDKQSFFQHEIRTLHQRRNHCTLSVKVDRSRLLTSSYKATKNFDISDWCKNFEITFLGEEGLDWGGLRREWFESVCTELFDPSASQLFRRMSEDSQGLVHPNSHRPLETELKYYEFAGKIVGKCLYESSLGGCYRQLVKARFSRSFLAQLIGLRVHFKYFETDDPELYKSKIRYIEENDINDMDLFFCEEEYMGQSIKFWLAITALRHHQKHHYVMKAYEGMQVIDLLPNGSKIAVTNDNKLNYLDLLAQHRLANSVKEEIDSFLKGLNELIPDNLLSIFDENELELLLCGMRKYSVTDLKNNYVVTGSTSSFKRVLDWFWTIVGSFTDEQMARLLQFTTGCSQLPPGGFSELVPKFQISPSYTYNTLPTAHTCFNNLCLPEYDSIEQFHRSLSIALNEGNQGFGLV